MVPRFFTRLKSLFIRRRASGLELVVPSTESEVFVDGPPYVHDASHSPTLGESQLDSHTEDVAEPMAHGLHAFFNPTTMDPVGPTLGQNTTESPLPIENSTLRPISPTPRRSINHPPGLPRRTRSQQRNEVIGILLDEQTLRNPQPMVVPPSPLSIITVDTIAPAHFGEEPPHSHLFQGPPFLIMDDESTHSEASEAGSSEFHADETSSSSRQPSNGSRLVSSGDDNSMDLDATFPADAEIPHLHGVYIKHPDRDDMMSIPSKKFAHSREWAIRGLLDIMPMSTIHVAQHKSGALHAIKSVYVESTRAARSRIADLKVLRMLEQKQHPFLLGPPPEQGDRFYWASWNGFLNIVTPFCPYGDLDQQCGKVDETQLFYIAAEMVLAINFLHENNIIHADVRPDNVFINAQGHSVLSDFENATRSKGGFFISDAMKGVRRYMAPEIIGGRDRNTKLLRSVQNSRCKLFRFSSSTDWWSLGITLLELWAGKTPNSPYKDDLFSHFQYSHYDDPNAWENFTQKVFDAYVKECLSVAKVPSDSLTQFLLSMLIVEPKQRRDSDNPWTDHDFFDEIEGELGWSRIRDGQRAPFSKEWCRDHETSVGYPYIKQNNPGDEWPALNLLSLFRAFEKEHLALTVEERYDPADAHRPRRDVFQTMHV